MSNSIGAGFRPSSIFSAGLPAAERGPGDYDNVVGLPEEQEARVAAMAARHQAARDIWGGMPLRGRDRQDWEIDQSYERSQKVATPQAPSPDGEVGVLWKMFLASL